MNEDKFWEMIDTAWQSSPDLAEFQRQILTTIESAEAKQHFEENFEGDPILPDVFCQQLTQLLDRLSQEDLLAFDRILERKLYDIDREEIHEHTDGSDDGFLYCRGFIVAMGKKYYDAVNQTPSNAMFDWECEEMCYISTHIHIDKFGEPERSGISRETGGNREGW